MLCDPPPPFPHPSSYTTSHPTAPLPIHSSPLFTLSHSLPLRPLSSFSPLSPTRAAVLRNNGHVVLADFGLAKEFGYGSKIQTTSVVGTPLFMAPEMLVEVRIGERTCTVWVIAHA